VAPSPAAPSALTETPPAFVAALDHAFETTDPESSRCALGCVQLRGKMGEIAATDGRHLLLQSGYTFGFEDELLVQNTKVFGCKELPQDQPVQVGRSEQHFVIRVGPWTFYLGLNKEGRFPRIEHVIPAYRSAQTTLELNGADAEFLLANLNRLPGCAEEQGVTFDLGGRTCIRAQTCDTPMPTEMVLTNSSKTGEGVILRIDRRYLGRAAAMGFSQICLFGAAGALLARDGNRQYVWMPLGGDGAIAASDDCLRIESPPATGPTALRSHPVPRTTDTMSTKKIADTPAVVAATDPAKLAAPVRRRRRVGRSGNTSALEQALALRDQLRTVLTNTKELIQALKAEKRGQKSLKLALDSLKQLQAVA